MAKVNFDQWEGFGGHLWKEEVNVRDFIQHNYTQYDGEDRGCFRTDGIWPGIY